MDPVIKMELSSMHTLLAGAVKRAILVGAVCIDLTDATTQNDRADSWTPIRAVSFLPQCDCLVGRFGIQLTGL